VRTFSQADGYHQQVSRVMGADWMTPNHFRLGASSLLKALVNPSVNAPIDGHSY
jgi:deoxyribose-phosphate aldolase